MIVAIDSNTVKVHGIYETISEAGRKIGADRGNISKLINDYSPDGKKFNTIGGFYFIKVDIDRTDEKSIKKIEEIALLVLKEMNKTFHQKFKEKLVEVNKEIINNNKDKVYV